MILRLKASIVVVVLLIAMPVHAQDALLEVRRLYESADFERALALLDAIDGDLDTPADRRAAREYRALCLLAYDRTSELERTLEEMIEEAPLASPSALFPPRLREVYEHVRGRTVPRLVRDGLGRLETSLQEGRYNEVLVAVEQLRPLVKEAGGESDSDADMATLETMARRAAAELAARRLPPADRGQQADGRDGRPVDAVYSSADPDVAPPVAIRQDIPPWQPLDADTRRFDGSLELIIDTAGHVREVWMSSSVQPAYDELILEAAAKWTFRPAVRNGLPVPYHKVLIISLLPQ